MDNETAVIALSEYLCHMDESCVLDNNFEELCFSKWAASELINAIMDHPLNSAVDTIEEFAIKMLSYSVLSSNAEVRRIFEIAANFAYDTLDIFLEEYESL